MNRILKRLLQVKGVGRDESGKLYRRCLQIAWPATIEGLLLSLISSADMMMVGVLGPVAIASVGLTGQVRMLLLVIPQALCVGTTALVARRKGAGNDIGARSCLQQSMVFVTVIGVIITLIGYLAADPFMRLAGANEDTLPLSREYFQIISLGFLPNCWQLCINASFRAIGRTKVTMVTNITANIINVILNYLLIGGHAGFPALGVAGAAYATFIGTLTAGALSIYFASRQDSYFAYQPMKKIRFDRDTVSGLAMIGSSSMTESVFLRIGFFITQRLIAGIGTAAFAAYQIVSQVTGLSFTLGDGIATAGVSMVAQSLGAGRKDRAMQYVAVVRRMSLLVSIALMVFIFLLRRDLASLFTSDQEVIKTASLAFLVVLPSVVPQNGRVVYAGCLRGAGDVRFVAATSLLGVGVLRPLLTYLLSYQLHAVLPHLQLEATGAWLAFFADAVLRNALLAARVKRGRWMNVRLV